MHGPEFALNQITQFGPYKLMERISVGGMAEVYKAVEQGVEGFERIVAVKRILPHIAEDDEFITMFKDEAKIAGQLQHGNIAQIYNLGQQGDSFYIALEYVAGKDLRNIFTRCQQQGKPMPLAQACFVVMKVCEGLDYAHNKRDKHGRHLNIVHRDVSPPNILVSYEGEVKLIDFGVAKAAGRVSRTQAGILKGKFGYMSPEQVRGMPLDRRSDVFSLGVVLYEVLVGNRLFQGETDFATLEMVRTVDVPAPSSKNPEIPKDLENIIMKALSGEPETRYQTAMELHDDLQAFMFAHGMFYSRKDLATWMRKQYAREIELEKGSGKAPPAPGQRPAPPGAPPRKAPPPRPPGNKTVPPQAAARPAAAPAAGRPAAPRAEAKDADPLQPSEDQLAAARKRSKTMLMSPSNRPSTLKPGTPATGSVPTLPPGMGGPKDPLKSTIVPGGAPPQPAKAGAAPPRPVAAPPAAAKAPAAPASDLDWDDDELETKLFDDPVGGPKAKRPENEGPLRPEPPPQAGQIDSDADEGSPTVQIPPSAAAVILAASVAQGPSQAMPAPPPGATHSPPPSSSMSRAPAPISPSVTGPRPVAQAQTHAVTAEVEVEDTEAGKRPPPIALYAAAGVGALLLLVVVVMFVRGGDPATPPPTDPVAVADTAAPPQPAATVGTIQLDVKPADARVTVNGVEYPGNTPRLISNLGPGTHKLVVSQDAGFLPFEQDVPISAGQQLTLPVKLQVRDVTLTINTKPPEATVKLLEAGAAPLPVGKGGESFKLSRKPGVAYKVLVEAPGFDPSEVPLSFSGEASDSAEVVLVKAKGPTPPPENNTVTPPANNNTTTSPKPPSDKPKPDKPKPKAKTAELKIGSAPGRPPATVWVDNQKQAKPTPVVVMVAPGPHTIKWKYPDGKTETRKITATDGAQVIKGTP
ncbi:Serine/threonine protein kinase [Nannocystis exedens]|uniref:Serine/threonine protein kinase n=1 Tax=Nannocystis exedens TaxID=54 RepID=A0A1I1TI11_9BACT|nr:Tyrosine-protein kinase MasK [Nannocystis exedens]SFD58261.1 Serine/threonine protein kinase [Nannocystis exedens]